VKQRRGRASQEDEGLTAIYMWTLL
jgi:hypothetical protein